MNPQKKSHERMFELKASNKVFVSKLNQSLSQNENLSYYSEYVSDLPQDNIQALEKCYKELSEAFFAVEKNDYAAKEKLLLKAIETIEPNVEDLKIKSYELYGLKELVKTDLEVPAHFEKTAELDLFKEVLEKQAGNTSSLSSLTKIDLENLSVLAKKLSEKKPFLTKLLSFRNSESTISTSWGDKKESQLFEDMRKNLSFMPSLDRSMEDRIEKIRTGSNVEDNVPISMIFRK